MGCSQSWLFPYCSSRLPFMENTSHSSLLSHVASPTLKQPSTSYSCGGWLLGLALPALSQPSSSPPQSHGLLQDLQLSATWSCSQRSAWWLSLHLCSPAILPSVLSEGCRASANLPQTKGKQLYQCVFSNLLLVTLVTAWSLLLPP